MSKLNNASLDDYHFLNDIETGFTTTNPMNKNVDVLLNQSKNITENEKNKQMVVLLDRVYKSYLIIIGLFLTIGLCVTIYLVVSKKN